MSPIDDRSLEGQCAPSCLSTKGMPNAELVSERREAQILKHAAEPEFRPQFTDAHVAALRKLRFSWDPISEDGASIVDPFMPYGDESISADLGGLIGTRDWVAALSFHTEVAALLTWALKNATIAQGSYPIDRDIRKGMAASSCGPRIGIRWRQDRGAESPAMAQAITPLLVITAADLSAGFPPATHPWPGPPPSAAQSRRPHRMCTRQYASSGHLAPSGPQ